MTSPLFLIAGMNCDQELWGGAFPNAVHLPLAEPTMDRQVDALLQHIPRGAVVVGSSLGAIAALALAVRAPERLAGLVVTSTNAKAPTAAQHAGWDAWRERLRNGESPAALQADILDRLIVPERDDLSARVVAMGARTPPAVLDAQLRMQATRVDLLDGLRAVEVPTLVVSPVRDLLCPPDFHKEIVTTMPAAELVSIDGGHLLPMEQPGPFAGLVSEWRASR